MPLHTSPISYPIADSSETGATPVSPFGTDFALACAQVGVPPNASLTSNASNASAAPTVPAATRMMEQSQFPQMQQMQQQPYPTFTPYSWVPTPYSLLSQSQPAGKPVKTSLHMGFGAHGGFFSFEFNLLSLVILVLLGCTLIVACTTQHRVNRLDEILRLMLTTRR
ncbi:hypothetical protein OAM67_00790 [bacterium]|nr:hypothetical protein [bacterium]